MPSFLKLKQIFRLVGGLALSFGASAVGAVASIQAKVFYGQLIQPYDPHHYATGVMHLTSQPYSRRRDGVHTGATPGRAVHGAGWPQRDEKP